MKVRESIKMAVNNKLLKDEHLITVLLCALAIPLSMSMWTINLVYSKFLSKNEGFDGNVFIYLIYLSLSANFELNATVIILITACD